MQVIDLIHYNHEVRLLYLGAFAKLPWSQVVEPRGLSFDSMRDVFLHLTYVEDRWISYVIPGKFEAWVDLHLDAFNDMDSLKTYTHQVDQNTERYLAKLSPEELRRGVVVPWSDKPNTQITVENALTHMVIEDMIHYGELSAAMWQMGLEAPYIGFWRYLQHKP